VKFRQFQSFRWFQTQETHYCMQLSDCEYLYRGTDPCSAGLSREVLQLFTFCCTAIQGVRGTAVSQVQGHVHSGHGPSRAGACAGQAPQCALSETRLGPFAESALLFAFTGKTAAELSNTSLDAGFFDHALISARFSTSITNFDLQWWLHLPQSPSPQALLLRTPNGPGQPILPSLRNREFLVDSSTMMTRTKMKLPKDPPRSGEWSTARSK
jgi:hypothetical protein